MSHPDYKLIHYSHSDGRAVTELVDFLDLTCVLGVNQTGILTFRLPAKHRLMSAIEDDDWVELWRRQRRANGRLSWGDKPLFRGIYMGYDYEYEGDVEFVTLSCPGEMILLDRYVVGYPAGVERVTIWNNARSYYITVYSFQDFVDHHFDPTWFHNPHPETPLTPEEVWARYAPLNAFPNYANVKRVPSPKLLESDHRLKAGGVLRDIITQNVIPGGQALTPSYTGFDASRPAGGGEFEQYTFWTRTTDVTPVDSELENATPDEPHTYVPESVVYPRFAPVPATWFTITLAPDLATHGDANQFSVGSQTVLEAIGAVARAGRVQVELVKIADTVWQFKARTLFGEDKRTQIRFSLANANIINPGYGVDRTQRRTIAFVGGRGQEEDRTWIVVTAPDYSTEEHIEIVLNGVANDLDSRNEEHDPGLELVGSTQMERSAEEQLKGMTGTTGLRFEIVQTDQYQFGRDYAIGDLVTIEHKGMTEIRQISAAQISLSGQGRQRISISTEAWYE